MVWRLRYAVIVAGISTGYEFITLRRPPSMGPVRHCSAVLYSCYSVVPAISNRRRSSTVHRRSPLPGFICPFDLFRSCCWIFMYTGVHSGEGHSYSNSICPPPLLHRLPFKGNICKLSTCSVDITFNTNTVKSVKRAPARLTSGTVWAYICTTSDTCMVIRERAIHAESGCSVDVLKYSCSVDIFYRSGGACGSSCGGHSGGSGIMCNPSTAAVIYSRQTSNRVSTEQVLG
jgi:hypothetical protein